MNSNTQRSTAKHLFASALAMALIVGCEMAPLHAQTSAAEAPHAQAQSTDREPPVSEWVFKTYDLSNVADANDANEILVALRNMLQPWVKIYLVRSDNAIVLNAPPDQQRLAQTLIASLDRPHRSYRLTYTLAEMDGKQLLGTQHYSFVVVSGQNTTLKEGTKVPVATGSESGTSAASEPQTQFTYLDIGMNFSADIIPYGNGVRLRSKVEQSAVVDQKSIAGVQEPVFRQSVLEGTSFLTEHKPTMLGSVDIPETTRRLDISVEMEPVD